MNLTIRPGRPVVGAAVLAAILAIVMPAPLAGAQPGPDDLTDDLCQPELEDCSPDECVPVLEILLVQGGAAHPEDEDCPGTEPCEDAAEGGTDECTPGSCTDEGGEADEGEEDDEAECPDPGPDPDPDPYDPPVPGAPNFTG